MPEDTPLYLDGAQRIMNLVKSALGSSITTYFLGAPTDIPKAALPSVVVQKTSGTYRVGATATDDMTETVYVHLLMNRQDGANGPDDDDTVMRKLQTLVEGRDQTTGSFVPNSLMYALRIHLTLSSASAPNIVTIDNDIHITYNTPQSTEVPYQAEAVVEVNITERQVLLARSTAN